MKTIEFDLNTAKKILSGEIVGGFITREGEPAEIVCILEDAKFSGVDTSFPIYALFIQDGSVEFNSFTTEGKLYDDGDESDIDLFITFDKRRKAVKKRISSGRISCTNKKLEKILQNLVSTSPSCKVKGKEKTISGIYRAGGEVLICLNDMEDVVEVDEIELNEED